MSKQRVTWDCQYSGQKRAYADTTTEGVLTIEKDFLGNGWEPWDTVGEDYAKGLLKAHVYFEPDEGWDNWYAPKLRSFQKIGPGQWYVFIVRAYDD